MLDIKKGCRLVQDYNLRLLANRPCKQDSLPLSITYSAEIPTSKFFHMSLFHCLRNLDSVLFIKNSKRVCIRISSRCNNIKAGQKLSLNLLCQNHRHLLSECLKTQVRKRSICYKSLTTNHFKMLCYALKYGRLSRTVWPYHSHDFAKVYVYIYILNQWFFIVSDR